MAPKKVTKWILFKQLKLASYLSVRAIICCLVNKHYRTAVAIDNSEAMTYIRNYRIRAVCN